MEKRFEKMEEKMEKRFEKMEEKMEKRFEQIDNRFEKMENRLTIVETHTEDRRSVSNRSSEFLIFYY